jgi:hypothetical protein
LRAKAKVPAAARAMILFEALCIDIVYFKLNLKL